MARARAEELTLFNFSFVDILATTIGVIVFIMVMVLINVTNRVSADEIVEQFEEIQAQIAKHLAAVDDSAKKLGEDEAARRKRNEAVTAAEGQIQKLKKQLGYERIKKQTLLAAQQQERRKAATLKATKRALEGRAAHLAEQIAQRKKKPREEVAFRVPRERRTTKQALVFECVGGRAYLVFDGKFNTTNYNVKDQRASWIINRKAQARGELPAAARRQGSAFVKALNRANRRTHFVLFIVRPDSFEALRELRKLLWARGYDYNWQALSARVTHLVISKTGGGAKVL